MKKRSACCCLCSFLMVLIVLAGVAVAVFFLWAREPKINFNGVLPPEKSSDAFILNDNTDFTFNLRLNFTIDNPNFIGASLSKVGAEGTVPVNNEVKVASGQLLDVAIASKANTTLLFPIKIDYKLKEDKDLLILKYIATNCGLLNGSTKSQLKVNYDLKVVAKVIAININLPTFNNDANFDCPIPAGTKIPGLDLILKLYNGALPAQIDPIALFDTIQKQLNNNGDSNTLNSITNQAGPIASQFAPIATKILG